MKSHCGDDSDKFVKIRLIDNMSGRLVCDINLTGAELVAAIAGRVLSKTHITWYGTEFIGWSSEFITELISYEPGDDYKKHAKVAVHKRERELEKINPGSNVSGNVTDAYNHHKLVRGNLDQHPQYRVGFTILRPPKE